jgi:hypothetical protein
MAAAARAREPARRGRSDYFFAFELLAFGDFFAVVFFVVAFLAVDFFGERAVLVAVFAAGFLAAISVAPQFRDA